MRTLIVVLAVCASGCGGDAPDEVETRTVVPVTVVAAHVAPIRASIHATGQVAPAPGAEFAVTAPEAARIIEMPKAEGDPVRRGDLLIRFEIPSLGAEAASKAADAERAEARLRNARAAQARARDLFERGVGARKEMEDADRELAEAEAALKGAHAGRAASALLAGRTTVRAPFDGIVARRTKNPGDLVEPSAPDPILRVIDPRRLEVQASVPLADVPRVRLGAPGRATVSSSLPPEALAVVSRPAAVEPGTAAALVRLAFTSPTRLAAGTPVQVDIDAERHDSAVLVPAVALMHEANEVAVMVAGPDNKAHRRAVTIGLVGDGEIEIASGLKAGDRVITHGQNGLPDGAPITVTR